MKRRGDENEEFEKKRERRRLICMQIDDFIDEVKLSDVERKQLESLAHSVRSVIYATEEAKTSHQVWKQSA